jgi:dipeptidyl aminopeptidase/acylaminoacyl peptidase
MHVVRSAWFAGSVKTLQPEDILRWRNAGQLALKPDGSAVAFVEMWCDADENRNRTAVFLLPTDGSSTARQITSGPNGDGSPKWSPDGRFLAFVSARETDWRRDLYILDMTSGGDARRVAVLPRGVGEFAWSADGTRVALTGKPEFPDDPNRPTEDADERRKRYGDRIVHVERLHYRNDGAGIVDDEQPALWVIDIEEGAEPKVVVEPRYPLSSPRWTPDGRIAFLSRRSDDHEFTWNDQVWAVSSDGGKPSKLTDAAGPVLGFCFTDSGRLSYTAAPARGLPTGCFDDQLFVDGERVDLDVNVGKHILADTVDPIAASSTPTASGDEIYVQLSEKGAVSVARIRNGSAEPLLSGKRVIGEFDVAGETVVFTSTDPGEAQTIRVRDESGERILHDPNPWLAELTLSECREIWVDVDGVDSQAWAFLPPGGVTDGAPPALISCHGGPHGAYGWAFNVLLQLNAAKGWTVIMGNPPGSLSYGEKFTQLTHRAWGEADFPHVMAYVDHAIAQGWADAGRLGIFGGSYGGYLTLWSICQTDRFKAAVAQRGVANLETVFSSSEFGWELMRGCFDCHPWEDRELFRRLSPVNHVENITTPLRLVGCTGDQRVAMEQVEQMYIALKVMGRPVDMVVFREGHSLVYHGKPWSRVEHARITAEWFERHL